MTESTRSASGGGSNRVRRSTFRDRLKLVGIAVIGVALSWGLWEKLRNQELVQAERGFEAISQSRAAVLNEEIQSHFAALHVMTDFYSASERVEYQEFSIFANGLVGRFPSLAGVAYASRVTHDDRAAHEAAMRQRGIAGYQITEYNIERQFVRAGDRSVYYPYTFGTTDDEGDRPSFYGFDPTTHPVRREAMERAAASGELTMTAPVELAYKQQRRPGFVVVLPMWSSGEERLGMPEEFLFGGFRLDYVLANSMDRYYEHADLVLSLTDITDVDQPIAIWPDENQSYAAAAGLPWTNVSEVDWGGRRIRIEHRPAERFLAGYTTDRPLSGLLAGLVLTVLTVGYFASVQYRSNKVERLVERRTAELSDANAELDGKNRRLAVLTETAHRFVDNVAHEFRTPLTVIKEFNAIVDEELGGPVTEQQHEYLSYVNAAADELSQMVDDFLDSSKLKANTLRIDRRPHDPSALLDQTRTVLSLRAKTRSIELIEDIEPGLPEVFCDLDKAARVLINLTINAIKFSDVGQPVTLRVACDGHGDVRVSVIDHGPGLSANELKLISQRFTQVGDPARTSSKGFGLGLNIAKELVWLNLGHMDIQSTPGAGSTFSFTIPRWEPGRVVEAYLNALTLAEPNRLDPDSDFTRLHLLEARSPEALAIPGDKLMARLSGITRATDLLMVTPEGTVLLLGSAPGDGSWGDRLRQEHHQRLRLQDTDDWHLQLNHYALPEPSANPQDRNDHLIQTVRRRMSAEPTDGCPTPLTEETRRAA